MTVLGLTVVAAEGLPAGTFMIVSNVSGSPREIHVAGLVNGRVTSVVLDEHLRRKSERDA